jgi:peptide/nickel transport system substrate-binding protein
VKARLGRIAILALAGLLAACSTPEPASQQGGTLVATVRTEPTTYNRLASAQTADELFRLLVHDTLIRVNRQSGALEPRLATSWSATDDGRRWTLNLREGVMFSDGAPFTADDVVFTFRALYDPVVASEIASNYLVDGRPIAVRATGPHVVEFEFPAPLGRGLEIIGGLPILPRHALAAALDAGTFREAWGLQTAPSALVGLGPFVLTEHTAGVHLRFSRNPRFWGRDAEGVPLPYLDGLELQVVPEQNAEMLRLEAGQTDVPNDAIRAEDLAAFRRLATEGRVKLVDAGVTVDADGLWFNLTPGTPSASAKPWLLRTEFRRAVSLAVSRQAIVNTVFLTAAEPIAGPVTPGHGEWFLPDLVPANDAAAATRLLAGIGLIDRDGDGMLEDARGRPVRFTVLTQKGVSVRERAAAVIRAQLAAIGVDAEIDVMDPTTLFSRYSSRNFDTIYYGFGSDTVDPTGNADFWLSSGPYHVWNPGQSRPATDWERSIDELMGRLSSTVDHATRLRLFAQVQRLFAEQQPIVYFAARRVTVATSARVQGVTASVLSPPVLWNAEQLSLSASSGGAAGR